LFVSLAAFTCSSLAYRTRGLTGYGLSRFMTEIPFVLRFPADIFHSVSLLFPELSTRTGHGVETGILLVMI